MMRPTTFVALMGACCALATTARGLEESPAVPSGLALTLQEVIEDVQPDGTLWLRLRYVAPAMAQAAYDSVAGDFPELCATQALRYLAEHRLKAAQAVISIASEPLEFGATAPEVTQYFEAYRVEEDLCIWEAF